MHLPMLRFSRMANPAVCVAAWVILFNVMFLATIPRAQTFVLVMVAVLVPAGIWRSGINIDPMTRQVHLWNGPLFPIFSETLPLSGYAYVSVMEDSVETFGNRGSPFERTYSSSIGMKLQPHLGPETQFPEDLPPVLLLKEFSNRVKAEAAGAALAATLGLEFRSSLQEPSGERRFGTRRGG